MTAYNSIGADGDQENLHLAMHTIHKYLDCAYDIMDHRYLAFLFNTGSYHWVSMVVVNPSCISSESMASGSHGKSDENACRWLFYDSMGNRKKYKKKDGLKGTVGDTDVNIISSVWFFMNVCTSFINAINSCNQDDRTYNYKEPFGHHGDMKGSTSFPCFDFDSPAILKQVVGLKCGLACVANAVAFVHHFENKEFVLSGMTPVTDQTDEIWYIVSKEACSLCSFWEDLEKKHLRTTTKGSPPPTY